MDYVANSIKSALKRPGRLSQKNQAWARLAGEQVAERAFQIFSQRIGRAVYRQSSKSHDEINWRNVRNTALRGDFVGGFD